MKAKKVKISEGEVVGGLFDLKQRYEIFYLKREKNLSDKISIEITLNRGDEKRYARRSLRFSAVNQYMNFIKDCMKALAVFEKKRKIAKPENYQYLAQSRAAELASCYLKTLKEV